MFKGVKEINIPMIIFQENFAIEMKKLLSYDEETDNYKDIASNYIPIISSFCSFWDEYMIEDYTAPDLDIDIVNDYKNIVKIDMNNTLKL